MTMPRFPTPSAFLGERRLRVQVAGAGGTGSMLLDGLARLDCALRAQGHPGMEVTVFDSDTVSASNIGRQRFARPDIGFHKVVVLLHRLNGFYGLDWIAEPTRMEPSDVRADLFITCVDSGAFRHAVGVHFKNRPTNTLWLDTGNGADFANIVLGHLGVTQGMRLPNVFDLYGAQLLAGDEDDLPSCSLAEALARQRWSINPMVANAALKLLDDLVHRGGLNEHGSLLRLDPFTLSSLPIDETAWAMMGYGAPSPTAGRPARKRNRRPGRRAA